MEAKEKYLTIKQLISLAKKGGVAFSRSNPYNRLRYYTKIGLLPNMVRLKSQGHYPIWALDRLIRIENYKKQGWNNAKIQDKFGKEKVIIPLDPISRKKWVWYFMLAFFASLFALGIVQTAFYKRQMAKKESQITGSYIAQSGSQKVFVFESRVTTKSKVFVTFVANYEPATAYYVSSIVPNLGFEITLSSPISQSSGFNYWIVE
jgi:hypothetical protein